MITNLGNRTLEQILIAVKCNNDKYVKADEKQETDYVVIALEDNEYDRVVLLGNSKGELFLVRRGLTDDDDGIRETFEMVLPENFDTQSMGRGFYKADPMTVREFFNEFRLIDCLIDDILIYNY